MRVQIIASGAFIAQMESANMQPFPRVGEKLQLTLTPTISELYTIKDIQHCYEASIRPNGMSNRVEWQPTKWIDIHVLFERKVSPERHGSHG